jgi:hypothetical protein
MTSYRKREQGKARTRWASAGVEAQEPAQRGWTLGELVFGAVGCEVPFALALM